MVGYGVNPFNLSCFDLGGGWLPLVLRIWSQSHRRYVIKIETVGRIEMWRDCDENTRSFNGTIIMEMVVALPPTRRGQVFRGRRIFLQRRPGHLPYGKDKLGVSCAAMWGGCGLPASRGRGGSDETCIYYMSVALCVRARSTYVVRAPS